MIHDKDILPIWKHPSRLFASPSPSERCAITLQYPSGGGEIKRPTLPPSLSLSLSGIFEANLRSCPPPPSQESLADQTLKFPLPLFLLYPRVPSSVSLFLSLSLCCPHPLTWNSNNCCRVIFSFSGQKFFRLLIPFPPGESRRFPRVGAERRIFEISNFFPGRGSANRACVCTLFDC